MRAIFSHKSLVLLVSICMAAGLTACEGDVSMEAPPNLGGGTNSIFDPDEDDSRRHHSTTVTVGGGGGDPFNLQPIHYIAINGDVKKVDAIWINENKYGGNGGGPLGDLTLAEGEYINKIVVRHGESIDGLVVCTSDEKRPCIGGGGMGGREMVIEGEILALGGRSGKRLDRLDIMGTRLSISEGFGTGNEGVPFPRQKIKSIAINADKRVDAIWLNGLKYGGNGGDFKGRLTLAPKEYINKIVVRDGGSIDYLAIYTNMDHSIEGGGGGGKRTTIREGKISEIGGRSSDRLDALLVKGEFMPSFEEINSKPAMDLVSTLGFEDQFTRITFDKNGFPLDFEACFGFRLSHCQDMLRLPDAKNKQYYMGTFSQNCSDKEGGMVFVGELVKGQTKGKVIWMDELNNSHQDGGYNHPGDLRRIGNIVVIAGQNYYVKADCGRMSRGQGNYQNVLFYDVSSPEKPRYIGKVDSCWSRDTNIKAFREIDAVSAAKSGDYYYLSFNDLKCRSKVFYPHAGWELIEGGDDSSYGSPVYFTGPGGREFVGGADGNTHYAYHFPEFCTCSYELNYNNLVFEPDTGGVLTQETTSVHREAVGVSFSFYVDDLGYSEPALCELICKGATISLNSRQDGGSSVVVTNVEAKDNIEIKELESR